MNCADTIAFAAVLVALFFIAGFGLEPHPHHQSGGPVYERIPDPGPLYDAKKRLAEIMASIPGLSLL